MPALKAANLAVKFLLELGAIAAFAYWGSQTGSGAVSIVLAIAVPILTIYLWGRFAAPKSETRLPRATRIPFEMAVFTLAALALLDADTTRAAVVFAAVAVVNAALMTAWDQWES